MDWYNEFTSVCEVFFVVLRDGTPRRADDVRRPRKNRLRRKRRGVQREVTIYWRCRKEMRTKITLVCSDCKQRNYDTIKNKKNDPDRLEMNKYCRFCRKHTLHKESK